MKAPDARRTPRLDRMFMAGVGSAARGPSAKPGPFLGGDGRSSPIRRAHPLLPVFRFDTGADSALYAPGHMVRLARDWADQLEAAWSRGAPPPKGPWHAAVGTLLAQACSAVHAWRDRHEGPYRPVCLTVYLSRRCPMACTYCFARRRGPASNGGAQTLVCATEAEPVLHEDAARAAARCVARQCVAVGQPFKLVLHGGGEPTGHWGLLKRVVALTRDVAQEHGVNWSAYLATGGIVTPEQARWLGEHIPHIGLSCDGPPDLQDRHRPLTGGAPSAAIVERTAQILAGSRARVTFRVTVTPESVHRQADTITYLHQRLGAEDIRVEPVYRLPGDSWPGFGADDADCFVEQYRYAEEAARNLGCLLSISGVRLDEIHGPYCNTLRGVLQVTPDGTANACFLHAEGRTPDARPLVIGGYGADRGGFRLDEERAAALAHQAGGIPDQCRDCVNVYHCARGCPDVCALRSSTMPPEEPGFRCRVNRRLAEHWLARAAASLGLSNQPIDQIALADPCETDCRTIDGMLADVPSLVGTAEIRRQWECVKARLSAERRALPEPVWSRRGFEDDGAGAWQRIRQEYADERGGADVSVYLHVPLCDRRCPFCDCYSLSVSRHNRKMEDEYAQALLREVAAWSTCSLLARRPVTTVHFGGGTPNRLRTELLAEVIDSLKATFAITSRTEWALESTSSLLEDDHLDALGRLGFTRLHVGIQTLEDSVRRTMGRREPAGQAMEKLRHALRRGFVVSVDIVYGLPGQTLAGVLAALQQLVAIGVHGFSLYQLQVSNRNRVFLEKHDALNRPPLWDYVAFQTAEQYLKKNNYRKTHFAHYARAEDANLYYTHAARGEDLLALGATADGVLGRYRYRHPEYEAYVLGTRNATPSLEGGVRETDSEWDLRSAITSLMAGGISVSTLAEVGATKLLRRWIRAAFLEQSDVADRFTLTANGSWFLNEMLAELDATIHNGQPAQERSWPTLPA